MGAGRQGPGCGPVVRVSQEVGTFWGSAKLLRTGLGCEGKGRWVAKTLMNSHCNSKGKSKATGWKVDTSLGRYGSWVDRH
jgi:hypothetical protein